MNGQSPAQRSPLVAVLAYAVAILGTFLIVGGLVWAMRHYSQPPPLGEDRAVVRAKALAELRAAEAEALEHPGWVDPAKGIVRLPIDQAMKIIEREWGRDPAAGRSNLIEREEKANPPPPPAAPAKPSPFE
jgi:hypothetical protein